METFVEEIYLGELTRQCDEAIGAVLRMNELLGQKENVAAEFFREATDLLQHTASASRLLWPPGGGNRERRERADRRGAHLRSSLQVADDHVLQNRRLRDHLEHYDERIDDWVESSPNRIIVDNIIAPRSAIGGDAIKDSDIMRLYDPSTLAFVFRGESFDIQSLVNGVADIRVRCLERLNELGPPTSGSPIHPNPRITPTLAVRSVQSEREP